MYLWQIRSSLAIGDCNSIGFSQFCFLGNHIIYGRQVLFFSFFGGGGLYLAKIKNYFLKKKGVLKSVFFFFKKFFLTN